MFPCYPFMHADAKDFPNGKKRDQDSGLRTQDPIHCSRQTCYARYVVPRYVGTDMPSIGNLISSSGD